MLERKTGIIDKFMQLPLFLGMDPFDVASIVSWVELDFQKYAPGDIIVENYSCCDKLIFILDGEVERRTHDMASMFTLLETIPSPTIIQVETLFGLNNHYTSQIKAVTETGTVSISKKDLLQIIGEYEIFRMNFINMISLIAQSARKQLWLSHTGTLKDRIVRLIQDHQTTIAGKKTILVTMQNLATMLQTTRANISKELKMMQEEGLLELSKSMIIIPDMKQLISMTNNNRP